MLTAGFCWVEYIGLGFGLLDMQVQTGGKNNKGCLQAELQNDFEQWPQLELQHK